MWTLVSKAVPVPVSELVLGSSLLAAQENTEDPAKEAPVSWRLRAHFISWHGRENLPKRGKYEIVLADWKVGRNNLDNR